MKGHVFEYIEVLRSDAQNVIESVSRLVMPGAWALEASYQASRFLTLLEAIEKAGLRLDTMVEAPARPVKWDAFDLIQEAELISDGLSNALSKVKRVGQ